MIFSLDVWCRCNYFSGDANHRWRKVPLCNLLLLLCSYGNFPSLARPWLSPQCLSLFLFFFFFTLKSLWIIQKAMGESVTQAVCKQKGSMVEALLAPRVASPCSRSPSCTAKSGSVAGLGDLSGFSSFNDSILSQESFLLCFLINRWWEGEQGVETKPLVPTGEAGFQLET